MAESGIMRRIMVALSKLPACRVFRNNVGTGWTGELIKPTNIRTVVVYPGDVVLRNARPLHAGLCDGSADLIGWTSVRITPEMVGRDVAVFTSVEVKDKGRAHAGQKNWLQVVRAAGGIATVSHSEDEALDVVQNAMRNCKQVNGPVEYHPVV